MLVDYLLVHAHKPLYNFNNTLNFEVCLFNCIVNLASPTSIGRSVTVYSHRPVRRYLSPEFPIAFIWMTLTSSAIARATWARKCNTKVFLKKIVSFDIKVFPSTDCLCRGVKATCFEKCECSYKSVFYICH